MDGRDHRSPHCCKQTQETGSAFRPAREAEMMRRLVDRHKGIRRSTRRSIWRVIISTFTTAGRRSPFTPTFRGDAALRDSPVSISASRYLSFRIWCASVVAAVSESRGRSRSVPASIMAGVGAWWSASNSRGAQNHRPLAVRRSCRPSAGVPYSSSRGLRRGNGQGGEVWRRGVAGWTRGWAGFAPLAEVLPVPIAASMAQRS